MQLSTTACILDKHFKYFSKLELFFIVLPGYIQFQGEYLISEYSSGENLRFFFKALSAENSYLCDSIDRLVL